MQTTLNNQLTSRIDNNTLTHTYQYDANGNQTQSTGNNARKNIIDSTAIKSCTSIPNNSNPPIINIGKDKINACFKYLEILLSGFLLFIFFYEKGFSLINKIKNKKRYKR
jgi:YD repeat-containing protein